MKSKTFTILGSIISLAGIFGLISFLIMGIIKLAIAKFQISLLGSWNWGFVLIPPLLIVMGIYYLWLGIKKKPTNRLISTSAILQLVAFILLLIGALWSILPIFWGVMTWGFPLLISGIPAMILMVIGIILMIIGLIAPKKNE